MHAHWGYVCMYVRICVLQVLSLLFTHEASGKSARDPGGAHHPRVGYVCLGNPDPAGVRRLSYLFWLHVSEQCCMWLVNSHQCCTWAAANQGYL